MKDSEADIAIGVLNKLIDQELEAVRAATRDGNTPFVGYAQTRHNAFLYARDEIRKALAAAVDERGAGNPFLPQRDELVTQDMHTCDLCGRWCSSPVYSIGLIYGGQAKTFTEVCADCMWRLKFSPVRTISLDAYRLFEQWRLSQSEADEMKDRTPHLCRNALGTAICASNGIGPSQDADRRIEHCVICGRWWKIYAVSPYLTIWVEVPAWMIWLFWHRIWKTDHKSSHGKEPEQ